MKILLAVDGSAYTKRMLSYLAAHDELLGPGHDYTAITVVPPLPSTVTSYLDEKTVQDSYREDAERVLQPVRDFAKQKGWALQTRDALGRPAELIAELANSGGFDLVMMGSHGHSTLGAVVMGSVSMRVVALAKMPVMLVR